MFHKKIKSEDLEELKRRMGLVDQYLLVAKALEFQTQIYIKNLLPSYSLDMNKKWTIDLRKGIIEEVKDEIGSPEGAGSADPRRAESTVSEEKDQTQNNKI